MKQNKIPIPPIPPKSNLYKPISFWSDILLKLDKKIQFMEDNLAFGEVGVIFKIYRGKIIDIRWEDTLNQRIEVEKAGGYNEIIAEDNLPPKKNI